MFMAKIFSSLTSEQLMYLVSPKINFMKIDKTKAVLVTGANGYVASWLVKKLLEEGITVHAAVRNSEDEEKMKHLLKMGEESKGSIKFLKAIC